MDPVRKLILEKLTERGLTMKEASLKIGRNHTFLQQFLKSGRPAELHEHDRLKLSQLLEVPEDALRGPSALLPKKDYIYPPLSRPLGQRPAPLPPVENTILGLKDLPVFGTDATAGGMVLTSEPVDFVARPAPLLRVAKGYGAIISKNCMAPRLDAGSTALIHPHLPPKAGDLCLFRREDEGLTRAHLKEFRRATDDAWHVSQLIPKKPDVVLRRSEWPICHVVIGVFFSR